MGDYQFFPWRGDQYGHADSAFPEHRVLILGESHYNLNETEADPQFTIRCIQEQIEGKWKKAYWTKLTKVLYGRDAKPDAWRSVAFYNYVQHWVGSGARQAPSEESWRLAPLPFRKVLAELRPTHLLVVSYRLWHHMDPGEGDPEAKDEFAGVERAVRRFRSGEHAATAIAIPHPSSRPFPKQDWHSVFREFLIRP